MSDTYKPTEHGGMKADGTPDKRVAGNSDSAGSNGSNSGEFAHGKVDPHEAGRKGGKSSGGNHPTEDDSGEGKSSGGSAKGEFAHGKVDPVEAGRKGGKSS